MKVKYFWLLIIILFISVPVFARERVVDNAGLLSAEEKTYLTELADHIASAYNFDLVIVTERNISDVSPEDFADEFFDNNGYGFGAARDGSLFLQVTGSREYFFSTSGRGVRLINNAALGKMEADTVKHLRANNPFEACIAFLQNHETFLGLEANGRRYNAIHRWNIVILVVTWLLVFVISFIIVNVWKKEMNTALHKTQADTYVIPGSLNINVKTESLVGSNVVKIRRQTQTSSSSGGGIRTSSSGKRGKGGRY